MRTVPTQRRGRWRVPPEEEHGDSYYPLEMGRGQPSVCKLAVSWDTTLRWHNQQHQTTGVCQMNDTHRSTTATRKLKKAKGKMGGELIRDTREPWNTSWRDLMGAPIQTGTLWCSRLSYCLQSGHSIALSCS